MSSPATELVTLTVDGKEVTVPKGTLVIRAAEQLGIEIPRFCDHPFLEPIGACRQCYVEIEGQRKLFTSCTTDVAPGMVVKTQNASAVAKEAQVANLEFLLLNHPLDCPICDRGGECPLQDQALAFGPGESRYTEPKRVYAKPLALSPLVALDRERCVLCARCTRFCDEISGDRFIELFARSAGERVSIAAGEDFRSPFSGNTVQICPVGALTSTPYRFAARPFDLSSADSVCGHCSSGCNVKVDVRRGEIVRVLARDNVEVNDAWICDKGRYAFRHSDLDTRVTTPLIRDRGLEPASFDEVFGEIARWSKGARVAFITGGRLADEDAYALSKLARTVFASNDLDHRRSFNGGRAEEVAAGVPQWTTYEDVERAPAILVAGVDTEQEVPILHLRIRKAVRRGARVFVIHPRMTRLADVAEHELARPEHQTYVLEQIHEAAEGEESFAGRVASALRAAGGDAVVIAGERLTEHPLAADVALSVANRFGSRFAFVTRRANDRGALRAGVHPSLLPGGRRMNVDDERAEVEAAWGQLPSASAGRSTRQILEASANGEIDLLFLIGVDPLRDLPNDALTTRALRNARYKVVQGLELGDLEPYADAFLPATAWPEREGRTTDWEGRSQSFRPVRAPAGVSRPDWQIFVGLAEAMGCSLGFETIDALREEAAPLLAPRAVPVRSTAWTGTGRPQLAGELTAFTYPLLVDEGRMVEGADELKAALEEEVFVEMHPEDAEKHALHHGDRVRVRTETAESELPLRVTGDVAKGAVFVPFNQPGFAANRLLGAGFIEPATVEPVQVAEGANAVRTPVEA
ncbi:MAG TPA: NADH-quinone oxidoreductase subunit G [Actinomycetota bacterium]|jgi:NADH-quinone oxidoreductase subunit G|nr:NADH-quinone oxidoreductase subunit G [Actinomycetota bacterium]